MAGRSDGTSTAAACSDPIDDLTEIAYLKTVEVESLRAAGALIRIEHWSAQSDLNRCRVPEWISVIVGIYWDDADFVWACRRLIQDDERKRAIITTHKLSGVIANPAERIDAIVSLLNAYGAEDDASSIAKNTDHSILRGIESIRPIR